MTRLAFVLCGTAFAASHDGMVQVPAGEFTMGRTKATKDDSTNMRPHVLLDDRPAHKVYLDSYWLDKTEVTQEQHTKFVKATGRRAPYHWQGGKIPSGQERFAVHNVDWEDADNFCKWREARLPTEAEWERAARGGLDGKDYPLGDKIEVKAARYDTQAGPGPVGLYGANAFGLFDMAGGVSEWTADWFEREYYRRSPERNPKGPEAGSYRVIRGGAWSDGPKRITVFFRNWVRPNTRTPNVGFRCAAD